jgi:L-lactate dehydrogenase complex protein LldG
MSNTNTAKARDNILTKLKKEVAGADYSKLPEEPFFTYAQLTHAQQIKQFVGHLENNHAQVVKVKENTLLPTVESLLKEKKIESLLYGEQGKYGGLLEKYFENQQAGKVVLTKYDFTLSDNKEKLFDLCPASITSSKAGIASTGSIVLWPTKEEPRTMSLVPPVHFVVVNDADIVSDFATLMRKKVWHKSLPTNALLISGPSKTADIQQTLAYGAHGPKELIVLLVSNGG